VHSRVRHCLTCQDDRVLEQPPCPDGHDGDCPDWMCADCGTAFFVGLLAVAETQEVHAPAA
jgi:hypothetical protein